MAVLRRKRSLSMAPSAVLLSFGVLLMLCPKCYRGEDNDECKKPWFVSISNNLTISWIEDDRNGTVEVNVTTEDTFGRSCTKSENLRTEFKQRALKVKDPCSNALYDVTAVLTCGGTVDPRRNFVRTPPDAPEIVGSSVIATSTTVKFFWKDPPGTVINYKAMVKEGNRKVAETETKKKFAEFLNLHPYTEYGLSVSASNVDHWSNWSEPVTVQTSQGVPHAPKDLKTVFVKSSSIQLKWEEPSPSTGPVLWYDVRWAEKDEERYQSEKTSETSFTIEALYPYTDYIIWVTANTEVGSGPPTNLTVKTALAVPDPPTFECVATNISIFVSWELSLMYRGPDPTYSVRWKKKGEDLSTTSEDLQDPLARNYTITGVMPFKTYEVQVRAGNNAGVGHWSKILEITTLIGVPSPPKYLRVHSKSSRDIVVLWDVPNPPNSPKEDLRYDVLWRTQSQQWETSRVTDTLKTRFDAQNLRPYTEYEFKVRAVSDVGESSWTDVLKVKTDIDVPSEPLNLTEVETTNTSILIRWLPPKHKNGPSVSYVVRWAEVPNDEGVTLNDTSCCRKEVTVTEFRVSGLQPYTNYSTVVCAKTSAGEGNCTEPTVSETMPGTPGAPSGLRLSSVQQTSLTLEWLAPDRINGPLDGYVVHWGVSGTQGSYVRALGTVYTALGLRPYTDYFFEISAKTLGGESTYSFIHGRTAVAAPSAPRDVIFSSVTDHSIQLEWSAPEHPNGPNVQYSVKWSRNALNSATHLHETNHTAYEIRAIEPSTNYSIEVCAETNVGRGPWTEILYVQTHEKDRSSAIIAGSVVGVLVVVLIVIGVGLLHLVKKRGGLKDTAQSKTTSSETLQTNISMVQLDLSEKSELLSVDNFDQHVLQLTRHGYYRLTQEFERLTRKSPAYPSLEARKNDNLTKNRWVKILPFDYSRVKLMSMGDDPESDYINASYIPGDSHLLEYIATQGPLANTVNDFWRMVWQQSVFLVVMLTQCVERAKRTCERYWPSPGETVKYGIVDVHSVSESITPIYIARVFLVTQAGKQRHVVQLHYTNWPVSGCPKSPDDFLAFVRAVRGQVTSAVTGPMLVHCSAGIGRTGTFIAVDKLSQSIARNSEEVDVFGTVLEMRKNRPCMVQTEEQYYFIYLCLQRIIQEKRVEREGDYGEGIYSN